MKVLFDCHWQPEHAPPGEDPQKVESFLSLEQAFHRIDRAIQRTFVWMTSEHLPGPKYLVRDVRILTEAEEIRPNFWMEHERIQVLLLEGWQTPHRVWTDEESIEEVEGVQ